MFSAFVRWIAASRVLARDALPLVRSECRRVGHMAALFVDLITPPGSPVHSSSGAAETSGAPASDLCTPIDLCTPPASPRAPLATVSNDVASAKALGKRKAEPADANAHKTAKEVARQDVQVHGTPMQESDDEVLETCAPPAPIQKEVQMGEGEDDDVMCTGRSGANALSDFPHARENCAAVRFLAGQEHKHCANCYCYVCDAPGAAEHQDQTLTLPLTLTLSLTLTLTLISDWLPQVERALQGIAPGGRVAAAQSALEGPAVRTTGGRSAARGCPAERSHRELGR